MNRLNFHNLRYPLLGISILTLLGALWAGLIRLGWGWPAWQPFLPMSHGPLMVSGFLGTLIGIERAVGMGMMYPKRWQTLILYMGPVLTGVGTALSLAGLGGRLPAILFTLGSAMLCGLFILAVRHHNAAHTQTMALGALMWLVGNGLWLWGQPVYQVVMWWAGFLVLTIAGERLELGRMLQHKRWVTGLFWAGIGLFTVGLLLPPPHLQTVTGVSLLALGAWLLRYDIARRTVRKDGLPRFIAACLLAGYSWLVISGVIALTGPVGVAGLRYDAWLHTIFLGFVFSMIFGHAPIIFPAVLNRAIQYTPWLYLPLGILHTSLAIRITGDLLPNGEMRLWGGLINAIAILLYFGITIRQLIRKP